MISKNIYLNKHLELNILGHNRKLFRLHKLSAILGTVNEVIRDLVCLLRPSKTALYDRIL